MRRMIAILLLLLPMLVQAQGHMFEAGLHAGAAGWSAEREYIGTNAGVHAGAHIYYNYISPSVIGFRAGLTFDCHNAGFGMNGYADSYSTIDVDGQRMVIDYNISNLRERNTSWSVSVPLQLAWNIDRFTLYTGAKAVFPMTCSRRQTVEHAALSVYYPAYDNRIEDSYRGISICPMPALSNYRPCNGGSRWSSTTRCRCDWYRARVGSMSSLVCISITV